MIRRRFSEECWFWHFWHERWSFCSMLCVQGRIARFEQGGEKKAEGNPADKLNPIFPFDFGLSFWTLIVFFIALWVLSKYAWKPIAQGLQKREDHIAGQIADAQQKNDEARRLLADYEKKLADAAAEVRGLIEQGRRDAEKVGQQLLDKAREEAGIEHQRAVQRIESATSAAIEDLASAALARRRAGRQDRRRAAQAGGPQPADRPGRDRLHQAARGQREVQIVG